jgi:hypothetical protein
VDPVTIAQYITKSFSGVDVVDASGDSFFFYDPERSRDPARTLPFATLVASDAYDQFSKLDRPGVFRLNIGVGKETFRSLFGSFTLPADASAGDSGFDYAALDQLLPHPVYGKMFWVCVLNPSETTFRKTVRPLLTEAYDRSARRPTKAPPADDA